MRDPELIVRAQRAATELELAWDRWRTMHGLGIDPPPPVTSYVGYSLEEPWGQPRVVFGIDAREAEQLADLLNRHDCAGPVYAAMTAAARRAEQEPDSTARDADLGRSGRVHVPSQVSPGPAGRQAADRALAEREFLQQRDLLQQRDPPREPSQREQQDYGERRDYLEQTGQREPREDLEQRELPDRRDQLGHREQRGWRGEPDEAGPAPEDTTDTKDPAEPENPGRPAAAQKAGLVAFRPRQETEPYAGEDEGAEAEAAAGQEAGEDSAEQPAEQASAAEAGKTPSGWSRAARLPGGHALPRQKRPGGAAKAAGSKQEGKDRADLADVAAEVAGWAYGALPGQTSHRRVQRSAGRPAGPTLG